MIGSFTRKLGFLYWSGHIDRYTFPLQNYTSDIVYTLDFARVGCGIYHKWCSIGTKGHKVWQHNITLPSAAWTIDTRQSGFIFAPNTVRTVQMLHNN